MLEMVTEQDRKVFQEEFAGRSPFAASRRQKVSVSCACSLKFETSKDNFVRGVLFFSFLIPRNFVAVLPEAQQSRQIPGKQFSINHFPEICRLRHESRTLQQQNTLQVHNTPASHII